MDIRPRLLTLFSISYVCDLSGAVELRNHPLLRYYGLPVWPPKWSLTEEPRDKIIRGEVGVLKRAAYSSMAGTCCHLYSEYEGRIYLGTLLINDPAFCLHLWFVLQRNTGHTMKEIGSLDMSYIG
jgi:hypothetical protein